MKSWGLHEAASRFDDVFARARAGEHQRVVSPDGEAVVVVPAEEFGETRDPSSLVALFRAAFEGVELDLERDPDVARDIEW